MNVTEETTPRRRRKSGSVYQRASDGLWVGAVTFTPPGQRRRKLTFTSRDRETAERKMREWIAANRPEMLEVDQSAPNSRGLHMARAREVERHTAAEWREKRSASEGLCHYCRRDVGWTGGVKDHVVPVSRGGSDGIDNVVLACWDCNAAKSDMMPDEFAEVAAMCDLFNQPQRLTIEYAGRRVRWTRERLAKHREIKRLYG